MSRVYSIYGLAVRSDWELPYCRPTTGTPILEIVQSSSAEMQKAAAEAALLPSPPEWYKISNLRDGSTFMNFPNLFDFHISSDGRKVRVLRQSGIHSVVFQTYLLTHAMSFAMLELGLEHLHATCLLVGKRAVAFLGDSGFGKSTLAAAFVRSGYPLITDDLLVFDEAPHGFRVSHGLPHLKLFPETCSRLGGDAGEGVRMNPLTEKLIIPLERNQFHEGSAPIRCLYVLAPPSSRSNHQRSTEIAPFSSQEAFVEVCKSGFNSYMSKPARLNRQFTFATTVASRVPIKLLSFANGIESLDSVRDAVLGDVGLDG